MPANLLGLMAIGMFYVATVVVGLCANRCLQSNEDEDGADDDPPDRLQRDRQGQEALVELIEAFQTSRPTTSRSNANHLPDITISLPPENDNNGGIEEYPEPDDCDCRTKNLLLRELPSEVLRNDSQPKLREFTPDSGRPSPSPWSYRNDSNTPAVHGRIESRSRTPDSDCLVIFEKERTPDSIPTTSSIMAGSDIRRRRIIPPGGKYLMAERNIGLILGSLSVLAIKTGGVYSNSIAQQVFDQGLLWAQVPIASSVSLIIAGAMFSESMFQEGYVTMLDPFQHIYGRRVGILLFLPILAADLMFSAVIISALGALFQTVLGFTHMFGVICSVVSMLMYLTAGGLYAGTFTDAIQFIYMCFGLWVLFPFVMTNVSTSSITSSFPAWLGEIDGQFSGIFIDQMAVLILGGIPMQSYFQRVLSTKTLKTARTITFVGSIGCIVNAVPALLIGAAAASTEWANTTSGVRPSGENVTLTLPLAMSQLAPQGITFLSMGALASGLLASCDSCLFGLATILSHNVYRNCIRPSASDNELKWLARLATVIVAGLTLLLCLGHQKWHHYWLLPYDLLYVLVFPQLFCVVYFRYANTYGCLAGLTVGVALRTLFGEHTIGFKAPLPLTFWTEEKGQLFPYRTLAMLGNLLTLLFVSVLYNYLYSRGYISSTRDCCGCVKEFQMRRTRRERRRCQESTVVRGNSFYAKHAHRNENDLSLLDLKRMTNNVPHLREERMTVV